MALPKIALKAGVYLVGRNLEDESHAIVSWARFTAPEFVDGTLWITSASDGEHMTGSKHYTGEAYDFRTRNVVGGQIECARWVTRLREELGSNYDVVLESTHLHAEYDPKEVT